MGDLHQLPISSRADRRLIDVTLGELRELVAAELRRALERLRNTSPAYNVLYYPEAGQLLAAF